MGVLIAWLYAAMKPRLGKRAAIYAALVQWIALHFTGVIVGRLYRDTDGASAHGRASA